MTKKPPEGPGFNFLCVNKDEGRCHYGFQIERLTKPLITNEATGAKGKLFENKIDIYIKDSTENAFKDILEFTLRGAKNIHDWTNGEKTKHLRVLVHCQAGMNRSVAVIIRYAIDYRKMSFEDALYTICRNNILDRAIIKTGSNWKFMLTLYTYHKIREAGIGSGIGSDIGSCERIIRKTLKMLKGHTSCKFLKKEYNRVRENIHKKLYDDYSVFTRLQEIAI